MDVLFAPFGVRLEASNSLVQAAFSAFLLVGIVSFAAPIISTVRVLLSLFVLPGKSVSAPHYHLRRLYTYPSSSPNLVLVAHGQLSLVLLMALARNLRSPSLLRATT